MLAWLVSLNNSFSIIPKRRPTPPSANLPLCAFAPQKSNHASLDAACGGVTEGALALYNPLIICCPASASSRRILRILRTILLASLTKSRKSCRFFLRYRMLRAMDCPLLAQVIDYRRRILRIIRILLTLAPTSC